jgi:hypothetical protein
MDETYVVLEKPPTYPFGASLGSPKDSSGLDVTSSGAADDEEEWNTLLDDSDATARRLVRALHIALVSSGSLQIGVKYQRASNAKAMSR